MSCIGFEGGKGKHGPDRVFEEELGLLWLVRLYFPLCEHLDFLRELIGLVFLKKEG